MRYIQALLNKVNIGHTQCHDDLFAVSVVPSALPPLIGFRTGVRVR